MKIDPSQIKIGQRWKVSSDPHETIVGITGKGIFWNVKKIMVIKPGFNLCDLAFNGVDWEYILLPGQEAPENLNGN